MGIVVPCLAIVLSLFGVMTLGFERSFPAPLDSDGVMKKSTAKFGERCPRKNSLVGAVAPRLVFNGRLLVLAEVRNGGGVLETVLVPTVESPPATDRPFVVRPAKPNWVPISIAKDRDAATTRASISTCCDLRSRLRIRLSRIGMTEGMSRMMSWFERSSNRTSPRELRNFLRIGANADALA